MVSGLYLYLLMLLHNCEDHFHLYSLSALHSYDLYHTHIMSNNSVTNPQKNNFFFRNHRKAECGLA